jgi:quercetin dioxygenase-like cupin family protein
MVKPGTMHKDPAGHGILFRETAATTNGELLEIEVIYPPEGSPPPLHVHPAQEETFEVISGRVRVLHGAETRDYVTGDRFVVPPGESHAMFNPSQELNRVIWQTRPALRSEEYLAMFWGADPDVQIPPGGLGRLFVYSQIFHKYQAEVRLNKPAIWVQQLLFFLLVPVGRLLGYRI